MVRFLTIPTSILLSFIPILTRFIVSPHFFLSLSEAEKESWAEKGQGYVSLYIMVFTPLMWIVGYDMLDCRQLNEEEKKKEQELLLSLR